MLPIDDQRRFVAARMADAIGDDDLPPLAEFIEPWVTCLRACYGQNGHSLAAVEAALIDYPERAKVLEALMRTSPTPPASVLPRATCPPLPDEARLSDELGRGASPWLDEYVTFSRRWSPRAYDGFHEAVGLWLLSLIAARRVAIHYGGLKYTPLFVSLTARTSLYAKSTTANIAGDLLKVARLDWLLLPDESTPQKLINLMATADLPANFSELERVEQERVLNRLAFAGQRGWYYEEFGQKIQGMMRDSGPMAEFRGMLRRFDDCRPSYESGTISRGDERVELPYLALLANMTPADLGSAAGRNSALWNDGFWARFIFVTPPADAGKRDPFPPGERHIPHSLVAPLMRWHERLGAPEVRIESYGDRSIVRRGVLPQNLCRFGDGVREAMMRYNNALLDLLAAFRTTDLDGNYARFTEKALRVAMLLASLENDGVIEMRHWARAQEITERWRRDVHHLYDQVNEADQSEAEHREEKICEVVQRFGEPTAREVSQYVHGLSSPEAGQMLDKMVEVGVLEKFKAGRTHRYRFPILD